MRIKMPNLKRICALAFALIIPLSFSGCMPYQELKEESIVEGMGIDYGKNAYSVTFQINDMQQSGGSGKEDQKNNKPQIKIVQSTGASLFEAVRNANLQNGRKLLFSNIRAFVFGEEVCKEHFAELLDFMSRNDQIELTEKILIAKGKAADILTFQENDEILPAVNIEQMAKRYIETSKIPNSELLDVLKCVASGMVDPAVTAISIENVSGMDTLMVTGTAVIHRNKLAGFLDHEQSRGFMWITGRVRGGTIQSKLPKGGTVTTEIVDSQSKITVGGDEKAPIINISVKNKTNITEFSSTVGYVIDSDFLDLLGDIQAKEVKAEIEKAIQQALYNYGADIFGFGQRIYRDKPELWRKIGKDWDKNLNNIQFRISVQSDVDHIGLTNQPTHSAKPSS